jgi:hypothetical protein
MHFKSHSYIEEAKGQSRHEIEAPKKAWLLRWHWTSHWTSTSQSAKLRHFVSVSCVHFIVEMNKIRCARCDGVKLHYCLMSTRLRWAVDQVARHGLGSSRLDFDQTR